MDREPRTSLEDIMTRLFPLALVATTALVGTVALAATAQSIDIDPPGGVVEVFVEDGFADFVLDGSDLSMTSIRLDDAYADGVLARGLVTTLDPAEVVLDTPLATEGAAATRKVKMKIWKEIDKASPLSETIEGSVTLDPVSVTLTEVVVSTRPWVSEVHADILFDLDAHDSDGVALTGDNEITLKAPGATEATEPWDVLIPEPTVFGVEPDEIDVR